jgi:membrane protein YdbS with pleckstrin-like domain
MQTEESRKNPKSISNKEFDTAYFLLQRDKRFVSLLLDSCRIEYHEEEIDGVVHRKGHVFFPQNIFEMWETIKTSSLSFLPDDLQDQYIDDAKRFLSYLEERPELVVDDNTLSVSRVEIPNVERHQLKPVKEEKPKIHLMEGEQMLWQGRPSLLGMGWKIFSFGLGIAGFLIAPFWGGWVLALLALILFGIPVPDLIRRLWGTKYMMTDKRLVIETGILNLKEQSCELYKIVNVEKEPQRLWQQLMKLVSVSVTTKDIDMRYAILHDTRTTDFIRERLEPLKENSRKENNVRDMHISNPTL